MQKQAKGQIVSYKPDKVQYEILCKPNMAIAFRENQAMSLNNVLVSDEIYVDAKQGKVASASDVAKLGPDPIKTILLNGHVTLSTEEKRKRTEQRLEEIISYIHGNFVDNAGKVISHETVKNAVGQLKGLQIDPFGDLHRQADEVLKKLEKADLLICHSGGMEAVVACPYSALGKVQAAIKKNNCQVVGEDYNGANPKITITVSAGNMDTLMKELERECKGNYNFSLSGDSQNNVELPVPETGKKGGKKGKHGK